MILTVRNGAKWYKDVMKLSPDGFQLTGPAAATLRAWVWGTTVPSQLHKRLFLRNYYEHNTKVIHGVPKVGVCVCVCVCV